MINLNGYIPLPSHDINSIKDSSIINFPNGDRYDGQIKDGKPHGKGIMFYAPSNPIEQAEGEWLNGELQGWDGETEGCVRIVVNRGVYTGQRKNGKAEGRGTFTGSDGMTSEGIWKNNQLLEGTVRNRQGFVIETVKNGESVDCPCCVIL